MHRRLICAFVVLATSLVHAAPGGAASPCAIERPAVPAALRSVDRGIEAWLETELAVRGIRVVAPEDERAKTRLRTGLVVSDGRVRVTVALHDAADDRLLSVGLHEGTLESLGEGLAAALPIALSLGRRSEPPSPPRLDELAAYERALEALHEGRLRRAWQILAPLGTAAATRLQAAIVERSRRPDTPVTERSRLASARGARDEQWFEIRAGLSKGGDARFLLAGADAALSREDRERARKLYGQAVRLAPEDAEILRAHALLLAEEEDTKQAVQALQRAAERSPDDPELLDALALQPDLDPTLRKAVAERAGSAFAATWRTRRALAAWSRAETSTAEVRTGAHLLTLGRAEEAALAYQRALEIEPDDARAWAGLGDVKLVQRLPEEAEKGYRRALVLDPNLGEALSGVGRALVATGRAEQAIEPLERAIRMRPSDARARQDLARAHRKQGALDKALAVLQPDDAPEQDRPALLRDRAELHREAGNMPDARRDLESAVAIDPSDRTAREALAALYEAQGEDEAAVATRAWLEQVEVAQLEPTSALDAVVGHGAPGPFDGLIESFGTQHPESGKPLRKVAFLGLMRKATWRARLLDWVRPRSLRFGRLQDDVEASIAGHFELVALPTVDPEPALDALRQFSKDRIDISRANQALGTDAVIVGQVQPGTTPKLRLRMLVGSEMAGLGDVAILENRQTLPSGLYVGWNPRPLAPALLVLLVVSFPFRRGWGGLKVHIDWDQDPNKKGFFHILLSKKPGKVQAADRKRRDETSRGYGKRAAYSRFARSLVERDTSFRWLPARRTYVCVYGLMQDVGSSEVIGSFLEERVVEIPRGGVAQVSFDFRKSECTLRVKLKRGEEFVGEQVMVGVRGAATPVRFARDDEVVIPLDKGQHVIVVGVRDRAFQLEIPLLEFGSRLVPVPLTNDHEMLFTGCPEAVEPFVQGDLPSAANLLAAAGHREIADRIRADFHRERGETGEAARLYEQLGELAEAAELGAGGDDDARTAALFQEAGEFQKAAEAWLAAGETLRAAQAFEADYDYERAIEAYQSAGDGAKALELLEKTGRCFEAAVTAEAEGEVDRAIRNLQQVDLRDPDYVDAITRLSEIFAERGEWGLAAEKLHEAIGISGADTAPLGLLDRLAGFLERSGQLGEALETYEAVLRRDFTYPGLQEKVQTLRGSLAMRATEVDGPDPDGATEATGRRSLDERYELLEEIGRGGMGVVFKAKDKRLGRVVALKQLPDNLRDHPTAVQLFLREARSAAALNHTNIVTLFDADGTDGDYYLTMELLQGQPLDHILRARKRLRSRDVARLGTQIATGLQYAHAKGIVHRDIKTSNLFFTEDKVVKIMDFGLAKMVEEVRRAVTVVGGTPFYMAPEQSAGEAVDHRADLYALGVTLYELATGSVPFREGDVAYHHRHSAVPDPREREPEIPAELAALILELMAKRPEDRPAETAAVAARLSELAEKLA